MQDYLKFNPDLNAQDTIATYDELPFWSAMFGLVLLKHLPIKRHQYVLDIGFGTGFPLLELAQRMGSTCTIYGIDPWEKAVERARLKARIWNISNVGLKLGRAEKMPFGDGMFDLIVSNLGLNNFADQGVVLKECWRVLKSSGRLALTTNLKGHMAEFYEVFASTLGRIGQPKELEALRNHIGHRATVESLDQLCTQAGFRITKLQEESNSIRVADGSALFRHYFVRLGFMPAWKDLIDERNREHVFAELEKDLNRAAENTGELALTIPIAYLEAEKIV